MTLGQALTAEAVADFLANVKVEVLDRDGDEFVIEFADGRTYLLTATEMK